MPGRTHSSIGVVLWLLAVMAAAMGAATADSPQRSAQPLAGAQDVERTRRVALIIANEAYVHIARLGNPRSDAALLRRTLERAGFSVATPLFDADKAAMEEAFAEFVFEASAPDVAAALFYYAGHGVQVHGENYLIPVNADIRHDGQLNSRAVRLDAMLADLYRSSSPLNIVILDACRNNPFPGRFRSANRGLAMIERQPGTIIAFSTSPGSVAEDGPSGGNSPFAKALAAAIEERDQPIEMTFKRARQIVQRETGGRQSPWEASNLSQDFSFHPASPPPGPEAGPGRPPDGWDESVHAWRGIQDSSDPDDFRAYVERYGNLNHFLGERAARRIEQLERQAARPPAKPAAPAAPPPAGGPSPQAAPRKSEPADLEVASLAANCSRGSPVACSSLQALCRGDPGNRHCGVKPSNLAKTPPPVNAMTKPGAVAAARAKVTGSASSTEEAELSRRLSEQSLRTNCARGSAIACQALRQ